ncbi:MAG: 3-keto-disaccharide hydrolase [Sphingobacterium sp.]
MKKLFNTSLTVLVILIAIQSLCSAQQAKNVKTATGRQISALSKSEKRDGFVMLFDGRNFDKWIPSEAYDITADGLIRSNPDKKAGTNLYTKEEYDNFIYRFEFKLTPAANNGIGIHAPLEGDVAYVGKEIQVLDNDADVYKELAPYQYHGSVYGIIPAKRGALKPLGEWNQEEIRVDGSKIKVTLNGQVIVDADLKEATKNGTMDKLDHPGLKRTTGHIGFLGHGSEVFFRNIRVKRL